MFRPTYESSSSSSVGRMKPPVIAPLPSLFTIVPKINESALAHYTKMIPEGARLYADLCAAVKRLAEINFLREKVVKLLVMQDSSEKINQVIGWFEAFHKYKIFMYFGSTGATQQERHNLEDALTAEIAAHYATRSDEIPDIFYVLSQLLHEEVDQRILADLMKNHFDHIGPIAAVFNKLEQAHLLIDTNIQAIFQASPGRDHENRLKNILHRIMSLSYLDQSILDDAIQVEERDLDQALTTETVLKSLSFPTGIPSIVKEYLGIGASKKEPIIVRKAPPPPAISVEQGRRGIPAYENTMHFPMENKAPINSSYLAKISPTSRYREDVKHAIGLLHRKYLLNDALVDFLIKNEHHAYTLATNFATNLTDCIPSPKIPSDIYQKIIAKMIAFYNDEKPSDFFKPYFFLNNFILTYGFEYERSSVGYIYGYGSPDRFQIIIDELLDYHFQHLDNFAKAIITLKTLTNLNNPFAYNPLANEQNKKNIYTLFTYREQDCAGLTLFIVNSIRGTRSFTQERWKDIMDYAKRVAAAPAAARSLLTAKGTSGLYAGTSREAESALLPPMVNIVDSYLRRI